MPAGLDDLPVEKIIEIRRRSDAEFLAFRYEVDQAASELEELADVRDGGGSWSRSSRGVILA